MPYHTKNSDGGGSMQPPPPSYERTHGCGPEALAKTMTVSLSERRWMCHAARRSRGWGGTLDAVLASGRPTHLPIATALS